MIKKSTQETLVTKIEDIDVYVFVMKAMDVIEIGYISERGVSEEKAAVQRIFSKKRVDDISKFVMKGGNFFSPFILNWNNTEHDIEIKDGKISFPLINGSAQLIDGQHRFRGIQKAMNNEGFSADNNVIVIFTNNLETKEAANIFTNINSKQQSVSKSLIYDLFKELESDPNHRVNRASDIAKMLNDKNDSPYFGRIVYPGGKGGRGKLQLSSVIDALKGHVGKGDSFERRNLTSLEYQKSAVFNLFKAISLAYEEGSKWENTAKNPFLSSAGFKAGIEVLTTTLLDKSAASQSISVDFFQKVLNLNSRELVFKDDSSFKKLGGKEQIKYLVNFLLNGVNKNIPEESEYEL